MNKTVATGTAGAVIAAAIVGVLDYFWALKMPAELAAVTAGALTIVIDYIVRWLPKPPADAVGALLPLLIVLPLLGACAAQVAAADAATTAALESTRAALDVEARALAAAPCKMSLGAWMRMENPERRMAVAVLCQAP